LHTPGILAFLIDADGEKRWCAARGSFGFKLLPASA
jgi:hypothetical protein